MSRRKAEDLIRGGRVKVNSKTSSLGDKAYGTELITVDEVELERVQNKAQRLIMYNKPRGQIVSLGAANAVFDYLPKLSSGRWVNVGRLDVDSEGLMLFSNDGDLANSYAHPKFGHEREYVVRAKEKISPETIKMAVENGVVIAGELVKPVRFVAKENKGIANEWYEIVMTEGRNRVVRKLFEHLGASVNRLVRVRYGPFVMPQELKSGMWSDVAISEQ